MRYGENVTGRAVSERINIEDGDQADDIERADTVSSTDDNPSTGKRRYKLFLKVLQKINMCFLILFAGYFAWTICASYGYSGIQNDVSWNNSGITNSSIQVIKNINQVLKQLTITISIN